MSGNGTIKFYVNNALVGSASFSGQIGKPEAEKSGTGSGSWGEPTVMAMGCNPKGNRADTGWRNGCFTAMNLYNLKIYNQTGCVASYEAKRNVGALKDKRYDEIKQEFKEYVEAAQGVMTKMIIEVCYLTDDEIKAACELCIEAGIDWVKSSTGQYAGPTLEQVILMADCCKGTNTRVKVSGVKDPRPQNAYVFLRAGADLIGTRQAPQIIDSFDTMRKIGIIPPYEGE